MLPYSLYYAEQKKNIIYLAIFYIIFNILQKKIKTEIINFRMHSENNEKGRSENTPPKTEKYQISVLIAMPLSADLKAASITPITR